MSQLVVWAKILLKPGTRDEAVAAFQLEIDYISEREEGTTYFILHADPEDENSLHVYEMYENEAAFDAHRSSDMMGTFGKALGPLLASKPELQFFTPLNGKGFTF